MNYQWESNKVVYTRLENGKISLRRKIREVPPGDTRVIRHDNNYTFTCGRCFQRLAGRRLSFSLWPSRANNDVRNFPRVFRAIRIVRVGFFSRKPSVCSSPSVLPLRVLASKTNFASNGHVWSARIIRFSRSPVTITTTVSCENYVRQTSVVDDNRFSAFISVAATTRFRSKSVHLKLIFHFLSTFVSI